MSFQISVSLPFCQLPSKKVLNCWRFEGRTHVWPVWTPCREKRSLCTCSFACMAISSRWVGSNHLPQISHLPNIRLYKVNKCPQQCDPVFCPRWCSCMSGLGTTCGMDLCASKQAWTEPLLPSKCLTMGVMLERMTGDSCANSRFLFCFADLKIIGDPDEVIAYLYLCTSCRPELVLTVLDGLDVRIPGNISHFILEQRHAHFLECRYRDARNFLQVRHN